jgi:predicted permease
LLISRSAVVALLSLNAAQNALTDSVRFDIRVVLVTLVLAFLTSITAHLWPVLRFFGKNLAQEVADAGHRTAGSHRGRRARHALLVTQTALSFVLIVCGGLLLSAFVRLSTIRPGYDAANVLMLRLRFVESAYPTVPARTGFIENVIERIQQIPGVVVAGTVNNPLTVGNHFVTLVRLEDKPTPDGQPRTVEFRRVSPGYFNALQIRQVSGRPFSDSDGNEAPQVAIINRSFADRFWTGENVLGKRIQRNGGTNTWSTVVGVVDDVRDYDLNAPPQPTIYIPFAQNNAANAPAAIAIRTTGDPLSFAAAIRQAIHGIDPLQAVDRMTPLDRFMAESIGPQAFRSALVLAFAMLGLVLTSIGIYGITARSVQERTDEFGIRVALGATRREIWRIAVLQSLNPVGIGMLVGAVLSAGAVEFMTRVLPGTTVTNSVISVPLVVPIVALVAAGWPAYAAANLKPLQALQSKN